MPKKILVVDDEKDTISMLKRLLEKQDFKVGVALNGTQAIEKVLVEKPDLIILDIMMPKMDGYEVCRTLKSLPKYKDIPIIFLSVKSEDSDIIRGYKSLGDDYITKPFNIDILLAKINNQLRAKEYEEQLNKRYEEAIEQYETLEEEYAALKGEFSKFRPPAMGGVDNHEIVDVKEIIGDFGIIEYDPKESYENIQVSLAKSLNNRGNNVIIVSSGPWTQKISAELSQEIETKETVKLIDLVNIRRDLVKSRKGIFEIPMGSLEYFDEIWSTSPGGTIVVFTALSQLLLTAGMKTSYQFVNNMLENLIRRKMGAFIFINREGHDIKEISGFENLFMNVYEIKGGKLKKIK